MSDRYFPIDAAMKLVLGTSGEKDIPDKVCPSCYEVMTSSMNQGLKLRMEQTNREKNRMVMWKSRVNLIKQARSLMAQKAYSEAAVQYEKYVKVLEIVNNVEKGKLSPAVFNNSSRSKELTVITSVYWDLMRIYDTSPRYGDRMLKAAEKLALFLPISPIYPDILKKAEAFARSAKNPGVVRQFLKAVKKRGRCFIASAVYEETPWAEELWVLRRFRDEVLKTSPMGRRFVLTYYRYSPRIAKNIRSSQWKTRVVRMAIHKLSNHLKKSLKSPAEGKTLE
jgi:hypothetical protein